MTTTGPDPFGMEEVSYAVRGGRGGRGLFSNRIVRTGALFGFVMSLSVLLGRRR